MCDHTLGKLLFSCDRLGVPLLRLSFSKLVAWHERNSDRITSVQFSLLLFFLQISKQDSLVQWRCKCLFLNDPLTIHLMCIYWNKNNKYSLLRTLSRSERLVPAQHLTNCNFLIKIKQKHTLFLTYWPEQIRFLRCVAQATVFADLRYVKQGKI